MLSVKQRAPRNRTLTCSPDETGTFKEGLLHLSEPAEISQIENAIINQDFFKAVQFLPRRAVDLLILDPPYNLSKDFNGHLFEEKEEDDYRKFFSRMGAINTDVFQSEQT